MYEMCNECIHAEYDYCEYYGGHKKWLYDGCKKDLEPVWNNNEEAFECEGFKQIEED